MRRAAVVVSVTLLAAGLAAQPAEPPLVITGATMLDVVEGRLRPVAAIVVSDGQITGLHETTPATLPDGATRQDASGLTLVPGLFDLAVQAAPTSDVDADFFYALGLAHGVTSYRTVDVRLPWAAAQRDRIGDGEILAPRVWTSGPTIVTRLPGVLLAPPPHVPVSWIGSAADARREVARQAAQKTDWVRLGSSATTEVVRAVVAGARPASLRVGARAGIVPIGELAQLGVHAVEGLGAPLQAVVDPTVPGQAPLVDVDAVADQAWAQASAGDLDALARRAAKLRAVFVPALSSVAPDPPDPRNPLLRAAAALLPDRLRGAQPRNRGDGTVDPTVRAQITKAWEARRAFVRTLVASGGRVAAASGATGTGWPLAGLGLHAELSALAGAGLTPLQAIRAATTQAAELLGAGNRLGQIRAGFQADLIAIEGDPLADLAALSRVKFVVRGGELVTRDALLAQARRSARAGR